MENSDLEFLNEVVKRHYSVDSASDLLANRKRRKNLMKIMNKLISKAQKERLKRECLRTRESDYEIIKNDWMINQPEKYALHLVKNLNRCMNAMNMAQSEEEKNKYKERMNNITEENAQWIKDNEEVFLRVLSMVENSKEQKNSEKYDVSSKENSSNNTSFNDNNKLLLAMKERNR